MARFFAGSLLRLNKLSACLLVVSATCDLRIIDTVAAQQPVAAETSAKQTEREAALAKMLSGATLDGNFTMTESGAADSNQNAPKLTHDKYTLGEVKKLDGNQWLIPARIQYGDKDFTLPLTLPIEWAGDTPVIVVENIGLPGMGGISARVMFYGDHYAGFWKHGDHAGHLFGVIRHATAEVAPAGDADH
jgi:hypothetical protein